MTSYAATAFLRSVPRVEIFDPTLSAITDVHELDYVRLVSQFCDGSTYRWRPETRGIGLTPLREPLQVFPHQIRNAALRLEILKELELAESAEGARKALRRSSRHRRGRVDDVGPNFSLAWNRASKQRREGMFRGLLLDFADQILPVEWLLSEASDPKNLADFDRDIHFDLEELFMHLDGSGFDERGPEILTLVNTALDRISKSEAFDFAYVTHYLRRISFTLKSSNEPSTES